MRNNGWGRVNVAVVARSQQEAAATITTAATKQHPLNISNIHTCCTNIILCSGVNGSLLLLLG